MIPKPDAVLVHYGMPRRSGRYPWGSGKEPYQHSGDFLSRVEELRKQGVTFTDPDTGRTYKGDTAVAKTLGMSTVSFRTQVGLARAERTEDLIARAKSLQNRGLTNSQIAQELKLPGESSVRSLLKRDMSEKARAKMRAAQNTADFLREQVDRKGMIDVGEGTEYSLNVSREKMKQAFAILEMEGYNVYSGRTPQVTNPNQKTTFSILCPPGTEHRDIFPAMKEGRVAAIEDHISHDGGETFDPAFQYPRSMDSKRMMIRYRDEGGLEKDGVIELRRGVPDLSLGTSHYSQVRILVDDDKYLKGMAVYSDDMPDGVDVIFNTNKARGEPIEKVLKPIQRNADGTPAENPFGSLIKEHGGQSYYDDPDGDHIDPVTGSRQSLSLINKRGDEGDWGDWSKKLPSQFLAKQKMKLIRSQLDLAKADKEEELDAILALTQPTVKKALLESFANDCDSTAVHLKAAALPRMRHQVILPINSLRDSEVYAPNFQDGEQVALVRFPYAGPFETPVLTVNNKNQEGNAVITRMAKDAVGITKKVADQLSGADFDGDTVLVIPMRYADVAHRRPLFEDFDPKTEYPEREGMVYMKRTVEVTDKKTGRTYQKTIDNTQKEMGVISNLIMDMTLQGATDEELEKAVKHSMCVIDAGKHKLDYKRSERENDIALLKNKYQVHVDLDGNLKTGGASTLITRAKSEYSVVKRQGTPHINQKGKPDYDPTLPEGALLYKTSDKATYVDPKTGKTVTRTQKSTQMAEVQDAHRLSTGLPQEEAYGDYANAMKALANQARKEMVYTVETPVSKSAQIAYATEIKSLEAKLRLARQNKPRERQATLRAGAKVNKAIEMEPGLKNNKKMLRKLRQQALSSARDEVGAKRPPFEITDREWEAIQAGGVNKTMLREILEYADIDKLRQRATPRASVILSPAKLRLIESMKSNGYTVEEIAKRIDVSTSTVAQYL